MTFLSIKYKILLFSAIVSLALTTLFSAFEINSDIRSQKNAAINAIEKFEEVYLDDIRDQLWLVNYPAVINYAEAALSNPFIDTIEITAPDNNLIFSGGKRENGVVLQRTFLLKRQHNNHHLLLGSVNLESSYPGFMEVIQERFVTIILGNALFILVIFLSSYLVIYKLILSDVFDAIGFANRIDPNNRKYCAIYQPSKRLFRDEVSQLSDALNGLIRRVEGEFARRLETEAGLHEKNAVLEAIYEGIPDAIATTDQNNKILSVNQTLESMFKRDAEDLIGQDFDVLLGKQALAQKVPSETEQERSRPQVLNYQTCDGQQIPGETLVAPFRDEDGRVLGHIVVIRDISERIEFEKRSVQAQKMEAIGSLAGGIAHDFNNILSPIMAYAQLLKNRIPENSAEAEMLESIHTAGKRAASLVRQILTFSRDSDQKSHPLQLGLVVKEALKLIEPTVPSNVNMSFDFSAYYATVMGDPTSAHQIVMNLVTNALHAIGEKQGSIHVSLGFLDQQKLATTETEQAAWLALRVEDTGHGIDAASLPRIFDPYFTTKELDVGTGLGLATVKKIVSSMDGEINVTTAPGKGARFQLIFPLLSVE